jgi:two-component system alkaline phosphatase synthesis response regulator PhoP
MNNGDYKILLIEDESDILELMQFNLLKEGFKVVTAKDGQLGLKSALEFLPQLIILDVMMPQINGLDLCRILRNEESTKLIPIIMLTAKDQDEDIIAGLEAGADDYVTKPFSPKVVIAKVKSVLKRVPKITPLPLAENLELAKQQIVFHDLTVNLVKRKTWLGNEEIKLTFTEFQLLTLLMQKPGWVFTRAQIVDLVRGENHAITDRSVDVQIVSLRRKLGQLGTAIETVRGVGYRFQETVS